MMDDLTYYENGDYKNAVKLATDFECAGKAKFSPDGSHLSIATSQG
jgi:hypothetical protein